MKNNKIFIYQLLPRLFGNSSSNNKFNGSIIENGSGKFNDITEKVLLNLKEQGYTHIWFIGIIAHASCTDYTKFGIPNEYPEIIKGKAGSPYAIRDYYDVDPDLSEDIPNRMFEFEKLIERTHNAGLKVIIDNVPNHVARNYKSINKPKGVRDFGVDDDTSKDFSTKNNFYYLPGQKLELPLPKGRDNHLTYEEFPAKATGNNFFAKNPSVNDWYETVKLNYGVDHTNDNRTSFNPIPNTWNKMKDIFMYWADKKIDGFRCDMAEMVPISFWQWLIPQIKAKYPEIIFIAEIYNPSLYRNYLANNSFDYLYDKVGLYDVLRDVACGYRPSSDISFTLNNVGDIQRNMLNFLENHDEQRIASDYFLKDGLKSKAAMIVSCCINNNPVMIYFGQEFGEKGMDEEGFSGKNGRTTIYDYWSVDTIRRWNNNGKWNNELLSFEEKELSKFYSKLLRLCNEDESLSNGMYYDLMPANYDNPHFDSTRLFAFLRGNSKTLSLIIVNLDQEVKELALHIPSHAFSFMEIEKKERGILKPLLNNSGKKIAFTNDNPITIKLDPHSGEVYTISFI